ncbi:MAG TPA: ABC transporter permease, partial [Anseongella sp.]|nr:ABC transporter permease [Anseongella sp.]
MMSVSGQSINPKNAWKPFRSHSRIWQPSCAGSRGIFGTRPMIRNYIKTAWRNLLRQRVFSAVNVAGLAIGMATCLLIGLFVFYEWSYDRFHEKADRIVRVVFKGTVPGGKLNEAHVMPPVAATLKAEYPEIADATRLRNWGKPFFEAGDRPFYEEEMAFADPGLFRVFTLPMLHGNVQDALTEPYTVVINKRTALKYFGKENAVGETLRIKGESTVYTVTGVMEDIPGNSHFHFDVFAAMAGFPAAESDSWLESEFFTYLELREGVDYRSLEAKLPEVAEKYMGPQILQAFGMDYASFRKAGNDIGLYLQPLTDIHLRSDFAHDLSASGDIRYVYIFGAIALFMLLIASINFMNLSTASASRRAKEVGVRKVLGSGRRALAGQFLTE